MRIFSRKCTPGGKVKYCFCGLPVFSRRPNFNGIPNGFTAIYREKELAAYREFMGDGRIPDPLPGAIQTVCLISTNCAKGLEQVMSDERVFITVLGMPLIAMSEPEVMAVVKKYRNRIGRVWDPLPHDYDLFFKLTESDYNLRFEEQREFAVAQLKAERALMRHMFDLGEVDFRYLRALRFWCGVFAKGEIRFVLSNRMEHGDLGDSVIFEAAFRAKVPVYEISCEFGSKRTTAYTVKELTAAGAEFCPVADVACGRFACDIGDFVHDPNCANRASVTGKGLSETALLESVKRTGEYLRFRRGLADGQTAVERFRERTGPFETWLMRDPVRLAEESRHLLELKRMYEAIAERPVAGEKFVFLALHLEPEATILNRGRISNQLFVARTIAENLPPGWKLYVKEHPMQFYLCTFDHPQFFHLSKNVEYFRSAQFYAELKRMPNTRVIAADEPSEALIDDSQAVATISGTVCLEAVVQNRPLMMFSDSTNVISKVHGVHCVKAVSDVKRALDTIAAGESPAYDNLKEVAADYLITAPDYGILLDYAERKLGLKQG